MSRIKLVGMDPSMSNWGLSIAELDLETMDLKIKDLVLIQPDKSTKLKTRQNSKDIYTAEQLYCGVLPYIQDAKVVFAEVPHGSQTARAMASYGMCIGLIAAMNQTRKVIQVSAQDVKDVIGVKDPTKQQVFDWAYNQHPEAPWVTYKRDGKHLLSLSQNEHLADATVALYAGSYTPEFQTIIQILKG